MRKTIIGLTACAFLIMLGANAAAEVQRVTPEQYFQLRGLTLPTNPESLGWVTAGIENLCVWKQERNDAGAVYRTVFGVIWTYSDGGEKCVLPSRGGGKTTTTTSITVPEPTCSVETTCDEPVCYDVQHWVCTHWWRGWCLHWTLQTTHVCLDPVCTTETVCD